MKNRDAYPTLALGANCAKRVRSAPTNRVSSSTRTAQRAELRCVPARRAWRTAVARLIWGMLVLYEAMKVKAGLERQREG